jgi:hypothetical protein
MREEVSLLQLCALGHGLNENIYLIGEDSGIGIPERNLYAAFSYSRGEPKTLALMKEWLVARSEYKV